MRMSIHSFSFSSNRKMEQTEKKLQRAEEALKKLEVQAVDREENKDIALGTSKLNYLDPRISVAWSDEKFENVDESIRFSFQV